MKISGINTINWHSIGEQDLSWDDVKRYCIEERGLSPASAAYVVRAAKEEGYTNKSGLINYLSSISPHDDIDEFLKNGTDCTRYE